MTMQNRTLNEYTPMKRIAHLVAAPLVATALIGSALPAAAFTDAEKKELGEIIRQYLVENPEVMLEMQTAYEKKMDRQRNEQAKSVLEEQKELIFNSSNDLVLGNPMGKVQIVEFYDYNCGYCKQNLSVMNEIINKNNDVRFVLKEWPVLGPDSDAAHRVSDAVRKIAPEKYAEFFMTVMSARGRSNEAKAIEVATGMGIEEAKLRKTMTDSPNTESQQATHALAMQLGFNGTPAYVVGDELLPGAYGLEAFNTKIANIRSCGKATC